jgi:hypothetical protein
LSISAAKGWRLARFRCDFGREDGARNSRRADSPDASNLGARLFSSWTEFGKEKQQRLTHPSSLNHVAPIMFAATVE